MKGKDNEKLNDADKAKLLEESNIAKAKSQKLNDADRAKLLEETKAKSPKLNDADKAKLLEESIKKINKTLGPGSVSFLTDESCADIAAISTGSLKLDIITGIGGIPLGRVTEIYGAEGCGKTTLALSTIACAQKAGYTCLFIDMEHSFNEKYAMQLGIDRKKLLFSQPNSAEEALQIAEDLIRSGIVSLIVIDSVAALVPQIETDLTFKENLVAAQARFMSMALRRLVPVISTFNCALIFINQIRYKIGVLFGNPETTSGGIALKFYSSLRMEIKRKTLIRQGTNVIGQEISVHLLKNKFHPPYKTTIIRLIYGVGFDRYGEILDIGLQSGILIQKGSWICSNAGVMLGQGRDVSILALKEHANLVDSILNSISSVSIGEDTEIPTEDED